MADGHAISGARERARKMDLRDRPDVRRVARWLVFVLRGGTGPAVVEAGATILTAVGMLAMAAESPGLEPQEADYVRRAVDRAAGRLKLMAEDMRDLAPEEPFPMERRPAARQGEAVRLERQRPAR